MTNKTELKIGGCLFRCPIPLVLKDRYFFVAKSNEKDLFSVFILKNGKPVFEIYKNQPIKNPDTEVTKTLKGIITVSDKKTGNFLYKIRPGYRGSSIFGHIKDNKVEIYISDRELRAGGVILLGSTVQSEVGIIIYEDGSTAVGASIPPEARHLFKKT
jgi:hypothetical protein